MSYDLAKDVSVIQRALNELSESVERYEGNPDALAYMLATLREIRAGWSLAEMEVESKLAAAMGGNVMVIPGVGVLERRQSKSRKNWDHTALASWLAARVADKPFSQETGERLDTLELCDEVAREILECAGIGYWKVSALKQRDCDAGKYCEESEGRTTVTVRPVG